MRRSPPGRIAYVDGQYLRHGDAGVHIEDRGLQFGDAIYEVCRVEQGAMCDLAEHLDRLERSLGELAMSMPMSRAALTHVMGEVIRRNRVCYGLIYLQITRGARRRDFPIPTDCRPTLILTARSMDPTVVETRRQQGVTVRTRPDQRWGRCDIKTTQLLAGAMAKTEVRREGAFEAWLVDAAGYVTEGSSSNAWIVDAGGVLVTRQLSAAILPGVTRRVVLEAAAEAGIQVAERAFTPAEAVAAREAFITSATNAAMPVVEIDGHLIGDGVPGPLSRRIGEKYADISLLRRKNVREI